MANSRYEYVKEFEVHTTAMPNTYIVVRIDGKGFTKFTSAHKYEKPNDIRGINLMNQAAKQVMETYQDIWLAYGQSDEYSFVLNKNTKLYNRRSEKIVSLVCSCFSSAFVYYFSKFFPGEELKQIPLFDGRLVCYPSEENLRDYLSWRQADCHINNLYNTCFWSLVQKDGQTTEEAHKTLKGTFSDFKNEMLFSRYGINYAKIEAVYRKGSIIVRLPEDFFSKNENKPENTEKDSGKQESQTQTTNQGGEVESQAITEKKEEAKLPEKQVVEAVEKKTEEPKSDEKSISESIKPEAKEAEEKKIPSSINAGNEESKSKKKEKKEKKSKKKEKESPSDLKLYILHEDLIRKDFWEKYKGYVLL